MMGERPHRLFAALRIPDDVAREIAWVRDAYRLAGTFVREDRLHVTLGWFGDHARLPADIVGQAMAAVSAISLAACHVILDRLVGSASSIALAPSEPVRGLERLQRELVAVLVQAGLPLVPGWRFSPHVTAAYSRSARFGAAIDPISWRAEEVVLIRSLIGATRHDVLGRWPLLPAAAAAGGADRARLAAVAEPA